MNNKEVREAMQLQIDAIKEADEQELNAIVEELTKLNALPRTYYEKSKGKIICISSICGNEIIKGAPITYSTAKAALNFYAKSLSHYLPKDISINLISPGNILFKNSVWDKKIKVNKKLVNKILKEKVPLNKFGSLSDIVNLTCYLISDKSHFITGSNFIIDGGQTLKL